MTKINRLLIEHIGLGKVIKPCGKTLLSNMARGALAEGSEEGLQEFADNLVGRTYDKNRKLLENVPEAALMGAILGSPAGGVNVGGRHGDQSLGTRGNELRNAYADARNNHQIKQAQRVVAGKRESAKIRPKQDLPVVYTQGVHNTLLNKHPEARSRQYVESLDHLRALQDPDARIDRTYRDKSYLKERVNPYGDLGRTSIKPVDLDRQSYINTAHIISDNKKIARELAKAHGVPAPDSQATAVKNYTFDSQTGADVSNNVPQQTKNVNQLKQAHQQHGDNFYDSLDVPKEGLIVRNEDAAEPNEKLYNNVRKGNDYEQSRVREADGGGAVQDGHNRLRNDTDLQLGKKRAPEAIKRGWQDIRGRPVAKSNDIEASKDIASLIKDYRNPNRELTHYVYTKDGTIVGSMTHQGEPIVLTPILLLEKLGLIRQVDVASLAPIIDVKGL